MEIIRFCNQCGAETHYQIPEGDHRPRAVCSACQTIFYQNPNMISGTLPLYKGRIMLCKRGIEPRYGFWTLPGGFLENGETLAEGALRETEEEACASVNLVRLLSVISLPRVNQVHCFYLADMLNEEYRTTEESIEIRMFRPEEIPWEQIAFKTVAATLRHYLEHRDKDNIPLLETSILPQSF